FVLDTRHRILDANLAARALVPSQGQIRKQPLAVALPELGRFLPIQAGAAECATEIPLRSDGKERFWDMHLLPLIDHGTTIGALVRLTEATERKLLTEALQQKAVQLTQADQRKDEFLAVLAHELRNPLAALRNALDIIKMSGATGPLLETAR